MLSRSENNFLIPVRENEFLPPIDRWIKFGALSIVAVAALAIPIASVTKYKETVRAQAFVRPDGELRLVQAATEGQIIGVAVKNNRVVKKGDVIATIDDSRLQTQKSQLQSNIQQARLQLVQINAQIGAVNSQINAETDRIYRSVAAAIAELRGRQRDYGDKQITSKAEVQETESDLRATQAALNASRAKLNRYRHAAKEGVISGDQLEEVQLAFEQQQQAVKAARAKLERVKAALNPSDAEVAIARERIIQERASGSATIANLNKEREALIQQRLEINKQLAKDTRELQQVNTELNQTVITATADGIVSKLNLRNIGQTVRSGEEIAQIAPTNVKLILKASVTAKDISKVQKGQTAQMRISACPYPDYGTLKGTVTAIAPDAAFPQKDDETTPFNANAAGTAFYEVAIEPESLSLGRGKNLCSIQLGMEGRADIITKEETVLQFLLRKARLMTDL
jgi:HlyD family type I secretion membrane fusion protein